MSRRVDTPFDASRTRGCGLRRLVHRSDDYAALLDQVRQASDELTPAAVSKPRNRPASCARPSPASPRSTSSRGSAKQADAAVQELELAAAAILHLINRMPSGGRSHHYASQTTEDGCGQRVDAVGGVRLACAWLIRRYIDRKAASSGSRSRKTVRRRRSALTSMAPRSAMSARAVTFEVMLASFGLEQPALKRIGAIVHYLDAGGVQPPEASGIESVLGRVARCHRRR